MAEQIADLVVNLDANTVSFQEQMGRVERQLLESSRKADVSTERMRRLAERQASAIGGIAENSAGATTKMLASQSTAVDGMKGKWAEASRAVDETHQRVAELSARLREEQQQTLVTGDAQDRLTASFFRQIDAIKGEENSLRSLRVIQGQIREARKTGSISQNDYLTLVTHTTAKVKELSAAEAQAGREKARFIQQLKGQVATQQLSRTEMLRFRAAQLGVGDAADIYIRKLEAAKGSTHELGLKSAAARRELGILFGEVARGNFGALRGSGITLANRAGWIDQLMTLRGLGAVGVLGGISAAIYGVGKAWYQGSQEAVEFNKQLILTGNYAGKTSAQLQDMAKAMSGNGITQHAAAGVLAQIIGSGSFKSNQLDTVARAAAAMQEATGQSVEATIKNFQKLYDSPTKSSEELNSQLHYLTSSQYEYISSLEKRGYKEAAAEAAAKSYSDAESQRSKQIIDNLGFIEAAIKSATNRWGEFWDAAMNIGRPMTEAYQLEQVNKTINQIYEDRKKSGGWYSNQEGLDKLLQQKKELEFVIKSQQGYVDSVNKAKTADEGRTKSLQYQNEILSKNQSWQQKRTAALNELWQMVAKAPKDWSDKDRKIAVAQINADNKPPATKKGPQYRTPAGERASDSAESELLALQAQLQVLRQHTGLNDTISQQRKDLWKTQAQFTVLEEAAGKRQLSVQEKSLLSSKDKVLALAEQKAELGDQIAHQERLNKLQDASTKYVTQMAEKQQALQLSAGLGDRAAQRESTFAQLRQGWKNQGGALNDVGYQQQLQAAQDYYAAEDKLRSDWMAGASSAWSNYKDQASDAAGMTKSLFTSAFSGMENALASFVTTGKAGFREFTTSILSDLAKIALRMAMSQGLQSLFSAMGGGGNNPGQVPMFANAKGGVYSSPSLSAYSGQVVNQPTFFAFAKGAGVMGEAGAEGILPLKRGPDGRLGVSMYGAQQQAPSSPNVYITIEGGGNVNTQADPGWEEFGKQMGSIAAQKSQEVINRNLKPGQPIWKAIKGA
uniref:Phage tail tape measure protein n=3 Tax=Serratia marcescens TaxID=615 RepID=A0A9X8VAG5_SERMA